VINDENAGRGLGWYSRGYLPHYEADNAIQFVTYHLADSLPATTLERLEYEIRSIPEKQKAATRRERIEQLMDAGHGACYLGEPQIAKLVQGTFLHFNEERYHLYAWVIMPNHVHVLFQPLPGYSVRKIIASWKSFTGRCIADHVRELGTQGSRPAARQEPGVPIIVPVWHREYWDRVIRDDKHFKVTVEYINNNPVKAGLVDRIELWPWSSVVYQATTGNHHEESMG